MINTYSKFYYGFEIDSSNKWIDIDEGSGEVSTAIPVGFYSPTDLCAAIQTALRDSPSLSNLYTVTFNRTTRIISMTIDSAVDILSGTGTNAAEGIYETIGFALTDYSAVTGVTASSATCSVYSPQFKLQDYVSPDDHQKLRLKTKNESASGLVSVQSFGTDRFISFDIKFATNIKQPSNGPIISNLTGVNDLRTFMQFITNKGTFEFIPDVSDVATYYRVILESTAEDSDGTGYKLNEQYGRGLVGYFETGTMKLRILED